VIHLAVTDDYGPIRTALRRFFEHEPDFQWAGEAADGEEALRLVSTHHVDVMLLDLIMPGLSGFITLPRLRRAAPRVRVVVFSACPATVYARKAVALGASNFVEKGTSLDVLASIVRIAMTQPIPPLAA
jgi:DNA-binding NarL/FixJ family response regulator